jgi:hypothetical protein
MENNIDLDQFIFAWDPHQKSQPGDSPIIRSSIGGIATDHLGFQAAGDTKQHKV